MKKYLLFAFTFHNVSINSTSEIIVGALSLVFTFHNVSINSEGVEVKNKNDLHLHSTMFLLIHGN